MSDRSSLEQNYEGVFDGRTGFGRNPALLVVDFINAYTSESSALFAQGVVDAVRDTVPLLAAARRHSVPIIYTRVIYQGGGYDGGIFVEKVPLLLKMVEGEPLADIVPELPPAEGDVILNKQYASAFFGTSLAPMLTSHGIDTVIVTGCSTSGCVRASALDAMQHGFRVVVPRECVGDRHPEPHEANLFDIDSKYGDVVGRQDVLDYFDGLSVRAA